MSDDNKKRKPGRPPGSKNKAALVRVDKVVAVAAAQVSELKAERKLYTLGKDRLAEIDELMMRYALAYAPAEKDEKGNPCRPFWESPADEARFLQREQGLSSHVFMSERDGPMTPKAFHALFGWIGARATHFIGGAGHAGGVRTRLFRHSRARMFSGCGSLQQPPGFQFLVPLLVYKSTSLCL